MSGGYYTNVPCPTRCPTHCPQHRSFGAATDNACKAPSEDDIGTAIASWREDIERVYPGERTPFEKRVTEDAFYAGWHSSLSHARRAARADAGAPTEAAPTSPEQPGVAGRVGPLHAERHACVAAPELTAPSSCVTYTAEDINRTYRGAVEECAKVCEDVARTIGALPGSSIHTAPLNAKFSIESLLKRSVAEDSRGFSAQPRHTTDRGTTK